MSSHKYLRLGRVGDKGHSQFSELSMVDSSRIYRMEKTGRGKYEMCFGHVKCEINGKHEIGVQSSLGLGVNGSRDGV